MRSADKRRAGSADRNRAGAPELLHGRSVCDLHARLPAGSFQRLCKRRVRVVCQNHFQRAPSRSAFFTCLMPTTLLCSMCSSIAGHPHVFARQDSRGHTHARMNYSRINEFRQQDLCLPERKFSIFSAFATLFPQLAQCPKTIRAPLSAPYGFFHPCRPVKSALTRPLPSSPRFQKPRRVSRPQTRNKI